MQSKKEHKQRPAASKNPGRVGERVHSEERRYYAALLFVVLLSFIVYVPILNNGFVNWDDEGYIQDNVLIHSINLKQFFSSYELGNYHPLTMLIYAIEYQFFGLNAKGYHAISLLIHLINVILVFRAVLLLCNKSEIALVCSLLFGIHPMHVESVAWASELKDLLYSCFFLASYIYYLEYLKERLRKFYLLSLALFVLALLSKAMAVSLPVVLLLTDYFKGRKLNAKAWVEKIPFFLLSVVFGVVAVLAQQSAQATNLVIFSIPERIVFACYVFISYLLKLILPLHLSSYYPYPVKPGVDIPVLYYLYVVFFLLLSALTFYSFRFSKKIVFGIAFFAVTVFLVLQLLPVGETVMADRYTYIPSIGIFYLVAEGLYWLWNNRIKVSYFKQLSIALLIGAMVFYSVKTYSRCGVWKDGMTLWTDVISQHQTGATPYYNRGNLFSEEKKFNESLDDYNHAIAIDPHYFSAYNNRGNLFINIEKYNEALLDFNKAIELNPVYSDAYHSRGILWEKEKKYDQALKEYSKAIELDPGNFSIYTNRGNLLAKFNRYEEALNDYNMTIALQPDNSQGYSNRGNLLSDQKRYDEALKDYNKAVVLQPERAQAYNNRATLFESMTRYDEALKDYNKAIELEPTLAEAYYNRGIFFMNQKKYNEAFNDYNKAIELQPDLKEAYYYRAMIEYNIGQKENACLDLQQAAKLGMQLAANTYNNLCN